MRHENKQVVLWGHLHASAKVPQSKFGPQWLESLVVPTGLLEHTQ